MKSNIKTISTLGGFNPLMLEDQLKLDGEIWTVKQGGYGWKLVNAQGKTHPQLFDMADMNGFVRAIKLIAGEM